MRSRIPEIQIGLGFVTRPKVSPLLNLGSPDVTSKQSTRLTNIFYLLCFMQLLNKTLVFAYHYSIIYCRHSRSLIFEDVRRINGH